MCVDDFCTGLQKQKVTSRRKKTGQIAIAQKIEDLFGARDASDWLGSADPYPHREADPTSPSGRVGATCHDLIRQLPSRLLVPFFLASSSSQPRSLLALHRRADRQSLKSHITQSVVLVDNVQAKHPGLQASGARPRHRAALTIALISVVESTRGRSRVHRGSRQGSAGSMKAVLAPPVR